MVLGAVDLFAHGVMKTDWYLTVGSRTGGGGDHADEGVWWDLIVIVR